MQNFKYSTIDEETQTIEVLKKPLDNYNQHKAILFVIYVLQCFFLGVDDQLMPIFFTLLFITLALYHKRSQTAVLMYASILLLTFDSRLQHIALSLVLLTFEFAHEMLYQIQYILGRIKNLAITMGFLFCLFAYLATLLYRTIPTEKTFFNDFGWTSLSLLQLATLDAWGEVGRAVNVFPSNGWSGILICTYIFLMTYFYMNILIGLVIETIQVMKIGRLQGELTTFSPSSRNGQQENTYDKYLLGTYYQITVFIFSFGTVISTVYHQFEGFDEEAEVIVGSVDDVLYTLHFFVLVVKNGALYEFERKSFLMMFIHALAGPVSLLFGIFGDQTFGSLLNLLKLATTPSIKGVFKGTFHITPILISPFMALLSLTLIFSAASTLEYEHYIGSKNENYFTTTWNTFYTYFQILTLDDWRANILPTFKDEVIPPSILFPIYIYISNFILLNILIALSCEYFTEVEQGKFLKTQQLQKVKLDSKFNELVKQTEDKYGKYVRAVVCEGFQKPTEQEQQMIEALRNGVSHIYIMHKNTKYKHPVPILLKDYLKYK